MVVTGGTRTRAIERAVPDSGVHCRASCSRPALASAHGPRIASVQWGTQRPGR